METITVDSKNFHIPSFGNILKLPLAGSRPFHSSASRRERNTELYTAAAAGNSSIDASVPELLAFLPYARLALLPPWTGRKIGEGRYARHRAPVPYRDRPPPSWAVSPGRRVPSPVFSILNNCGNPSHLHSGRAGGIFDHGHAIVGPAPGSCKPRSSNRIGERQSWLKR